MAPTDPEPAPEAEHLPEPLQAPEPVPSDLGSATAGVHSSAPERRGRGRWLWLGLVIVVAALLGLGLGVGVELRGRTLGRPATADTASRPTFVIGASVSPAVPSVSPSPVVATASVSADAVFVEVQPGDTLRSIAHDVYGDSNEWPRIYDANRDAIGPDPDTLQAGMRLRIP